MRFVIANTALFFALTGILFYQYFFQSPVAPAPQIVAVADRAPAATRSILPVPHKVVAEKTAVELDLKLNLTCRDSHKEITQSNHYFILNLKKCAKEFPKNISIENQTNGFTASVFTLNESHAKTDSIPLKKGKNAVVIKYFVAKAKSKSETEVIERLTIQHD